MIDLEIEDGIRPRRTSHKRPPGTEPAQTGMNLGVKVRSGSKYGLRIARDTYAQINKRSSTHFPRERNPELWDALAHHYEDKDHRIHTDAWCIEHQARALKNFDLNMAFFASLDHAEFDQAVTEAVAAQRSMVEVTDLNEWDQRRGLYVMILDDYCQAYVGVTESEGGVNTRIRRHWSSNKAFDRLLWGDVNHSILSIDSFRALDTTRVFAANVRNPYRLEDRVIQSLPPRFLLNRTMGGRGGLLGLASLLGADMVKKRDLPERP